MPELERLLKQHLCVTPRRKGPEVGGVKVALRKLFEEIRKRTLSGERTKIPHFGVFYRSQRKARAILHPRLPEMLQLPSSQRVAFRSSKFARQRQL